MDSLNIQKLSQIVRLTVSVFAFIAFSSWGLAQTNESPASSQAAESGVASQIHLFILSGQSNMAGLDPDLTFTPAVNEAFGKDNVVVVKDAQGGQPIRRWFKGWEIGEGKPVKGKNPHGDLYDRLMKKVTAATKGKSFKSVTFVWMQGERDAVEMHADVYGRSFEGVIQQLRSDLGYDKVNFVIGRLSDFNMDNSRYKHWTKVREVQVQLAESNPRGEWVDTDDLNDGFNRKGKPIANDLHYSVEGYKTLGERFANKAIALVGKKGPSKKKKGIVDPDRELVYKPLENSELKLFVFQPKDWDASDDRPAIVFFFGGGWVGGSPNQFYKQARYFAQRGYVAFCADYRTKSKHGTTPKECVADGKSAIRWVRSHAAELGINSNKIVAAGGSAGGHVAACTAVVKEFSEADESADVSCVPNALVLFNPVFDNSESGYGFRSVKDYWKEISPLHNLSSGTPPTIVFLGTNDKLIPVATAEKYKSLMEANGDRCDLHLYSGQPHGFFNGGKNFLDTTIKSDEFLVSLGMADGEPDKKLLRQIVREQSQRRNSAKRKKNNPSKDGADKDLP